MNSVKRIFVSLILLIGFLTATAGTQMTGKKAFMVNGAKGTTAADPSGSCQATFYDSKKIAEGFTGHPVLVDWKDSCENKYRVVVTNQDKPGLAEIHQYTHVFYILAGTTTVVTGGTIVDPKTVEPSTPWAAEEIRGTGIMGGETHQLSKGEVMIVPKGEPHWMKESHGLVYLLIHIN